MEQNYNCMNAQWLSPLAVKTSKQNSVNILKENSKKLIVPLKAYLSPKRASLVM